MSILLVGLVTGALMDSFKQLQVIKCAACLLLKIFFSVWIKWNYSPRNPWPL